MTIAEMIQNEGPVRGDTGAKTFIAYVYDEFDEVIEDYVLRGEERIYDDNEKGAYECLYDAAKMICFADCSDEIVEVICINGWQITYKGWQSEMLFEFVDSTSGEVIYSRYFSNWEH